MLNQRAISFQALMCVVIATTLVGRAETIVRFPNVSVGDLYYTEPSKFFCGPDVEVYGLFSEWQYLAPARGEVHLPDGALIQLSLSLEPEKSRSSQDLSWVRDIPSDAIHALSIVNTEISDECFAQFTHWVGLRELKLMRCGLTSKIAKDLAKFTELKSLALAGLPNIGDEVLDEIAKLPHLQSFRLHKGRVTDVGMSFLARSTSLSCISIDGVALTDAGVEALVKLPRLVSLQVYAPELEDQQKSTGNLGQQARITDVGLEHIGRCPQLKSLNIHGARVTLPGLQRLFQRCPDLISLALSQSAIDVGGLKAASELRSLQRIRIADTTLDDNIASQLSYLKNLREISGQLQLSNRGVEKLATLARLESLDFTGSADDQCVSALANLRSLRKLWIQHTQITDEGLAQLSGMPQLESVLLSGRSFTSGCLRTVATWPKIKELALVQLAPTPDGNSAWVELQQMKHLRSLRLAACSDVNDDVLRSISGLEELESLQLEGGSLHAITNEGARHIARLPRLRSLSINASIINNEGISFWQSLDSLEVLALTCMATPIALENLAYLKRLNFLRICSSDLSEADIADFNAVTLR